MNVPDLTGRKKPNVIDTGDRLNSFYDLFMDFDVQERNSCFKVAVIELVSEEQWQKIVNRTRELLKGLSSTTPKKS